MSENPLQKTVEDMFSEFITSQKAKNLSEVTIGTYRCHIRSISKHLDLKIRMSELSKRDLEAMVVFMRESGLAHNSISSHCRVLRSFLGWCRREGIEVPELPNIHDRETVKVDLAESNIFPSAADIFMLRDPNAVTRRVKRFMKTHGLPDV